MKIQIRLHNELLNSGLVIGDTPGMTDGNQDVVNATTNYLDRASVVLLVEEKKRLTANKTLDQNLRECLWRGKQGDNIRLVLTAIDKTESKISNSKRSELSREDIRALNDAEAIVSQLESRASDLAREKNDLMMTQGTVDFNEFRRIEKELSDMPIRLKHAQAHVKQVAIAISIRETELDVKEKLRNFGRERKAPNLAVHGVSNKDYQIHRAGYPANDPPSLDIDGTGIPALRHTLYAKAASRKYSTLHRICHIQLPAILNGIIGILTKSRLERKQEVVKVIERVLEGHSIAGDVVAELRNRFSLHIIETVETNEEAWLRKAGSTVTSFKRLAKGMNPSKIGLTSKSDWLSQLLQEDQHFCDIG